MRGGGDRRLAAACLSTLDFRLLTLDLRLSTCTILDFHQIPLIMHPANSYDPRGQTRPWSFTNTRRTRIAHRAGGRTPVEPADLGGSGAGRATRPQSRLRYGALLCSSDAISTNGLGRAALGEIRARAGLHDVTLIRSRWSRSAQTSKWKLQTET